MTVKISTDARDTSQRRMQKRNCCKIKQQLLKILEGLHPAGVGVDAIRPRVINNRPY